MAVKRHLVGVAPGGVTLRNFTRICVLKVWKRTHFEGHV